MYIYMYICLMLWTAEAALCKVSWTDQLVYDSPASRVSFAFVLRLAVFRACRQHT